MARNLQSKGHLMYVYDANISVCRGFPKIASSIAEISSKCNIILTMLPNSEDVYNVTIGSGIMNEGNRGKAVIDCSTVSPSTEQEIWKIAKSHNISYLDAPVSGGVKGAETGSLSFMVGGSESDFNRLRSILLSMGKNVFYCGKSGNGQVAKICNNLLLGTSMIALSEAIILAESNGLDPKKFKEVINSSSGRSWASETHYPYPNVDPMAPASSEYKPGFLSQLMVKDLQLAKELRKASDCNLSATMVAIDTYQRMCEKGDYKNLDFSVIFKYLDNRKC